MQIFRMVNLNSFENKVNLNILVSVFLMIYLSNDTLLFGTNANGSVKLIGYAGVLILTLYWLFYRGKIPQKSLMIAVILFLCGIITMITTLTIDIKYAYSILLVLLATFFTSKVKFADFLIAYQKIMLFLAAFSVVMFLVYEIAYPVMSIFPIVKNEIDHQFFFSIFDLSFVETPYYPHRSYGIFREPGVYMVFLVLAIVFELFFVSKSDLKKLLVLILALVFTKSTAGYVILVGVIFAYCFFASGHEDLVQKKIRKLLFAGMFIAILWLLCDIDIFFRLFGKIFSDSDSKTSRFDSIIININILFSDWYRILTGVGFDVVESSFRVYASKIGSTATDNTNTIFRLMATYGLVYTSILVTLWYKFFEKVKGSFLALCFFGIFVLCLFNESLIMNIMLYIIAFYSLGNNSGLYKREG